jgi:hypothetical protein
VAPSTSRAVVVCLLAGLGVQGVAAKLDKEGGQPDETRLDQSGIAFCSAGEEVLLGVLFVLFCGWREGMPVEDVCWCVLGRGRRMLRMMSFFCRVRIRAATSNCRLSVGRACVCSVRRTDELTTHDRAHGAEAMDGRAEASRERRGRHALRFTQTTCTTRTGEGLWRATAGRLWCLRRMSDGSQTGFSGQLETRWQVRAAALGGNRRRGCKAVRAARTSGRGHGRAVSCCVACCVE